MQKSIIASISKRGGGLDNAGGLFHALGLSRKSAFTLAEVLITLGIIGVVASLTLPTLIQKQQEKIWINQFKSTYSILSQAYVRAYQEHGLLDEWNLSTEDTKSSTKTVAEKLLPYLKLSKNFGQNDKNSSHGLPNIYLELDGKQSINWNGWRDVEYIFALANGATVGLNGVISGRDSNNNSENKAIFYLDINGAKGPNQFGKDFFIMLFNTKNKYPVITGYNLWWLTEESCSRTKRQAWYSGGSCATWLIKTGNMDYLHREISHEEWIQ